jgi:hypothetical protein
MLDTPAASPARTSEVMAVWARPPAQLQQISPFARGTAHQRIAAEFILNRASNIRHTVFRRGTHGEPAIHQMRPSEGDEVGAAGGEDGIDLVG